MSRDLTRVVAFWCISIAIVVISIRLNGLFWPIILCVYLGVFCLGIILKEGPLIRLIFISLIFLPGFTIPLNFNSDYLLLTDRLRVGFVFSLPLISAYTVKNIQVILSLWRFMWPVMLLIIQILFHTFSNNVFSAFQIIQEFIYLLGIIIIMQKSKEIEWLIDKKVAAFIFVMFSLDVLITQLGVVPWTISYRGGMQGLFFAHELSYASFLLCGIVLWRHHLGRNIVYIIALYLCTYMLLRTNIKSAVLALIVIGFIDYFGSYKKLAYLFSGISIAYLFINFQEFSSLVSRAGTIVFYGYIYLKESVIFGLAPGFIFYEMRANLSEVVFTNYGNVFEGVLAWNTSILDEARERVSYQIMDPFMVHNGFLGFIYSYGLLGIYVVVRIFKKFRFNNRYKTLLFSAMVIMMFLHTKVYLLELVILANTKFLFYESSHSRRGLRNSVK